MEYVVGIHDTRLMMMIVMTPREKNLHNDERMLSHERVCLISVCHRIVFFVVSLVECVYI